jgi:hypothetical protein
MAKKRKAQNHNKDGAKALAAGKLNSRSAVTTFTSFPSDLLLRLAPQKRALEDLHPGAVWIVRDFLTTSECKAWIDCCETSGGLEYTNLPATKYTAQRECYRMQQTNATEIASQLYQRLEDSAILKQLTDELTCFSRRSPPYRPVGFNPNVRFYKYTKGHAFGKHVDGLNRVPGIGQTEITILIYLSQCQGGATRFYPPRTREPIAFDPEPGTMLLHVHGDQCLEHEADPVMDGTKYVLRTDMVFATVMDS